MSVKYTVVARVNPQDPQGPKKYYPQVKATGKVTLRDLANEAAKVSTLSPIDMAAAAEALLSIIPGQLADGKTIELGDFGTFRLRIRTEGADTPEQVTSRNIIKTLMNFRPGKLFQDVLNKISYEKFG